MNSQWRSVQELVDQRDEIIREHAALREDIKEIQSILIALKKSLYHVPQLRINRRPFDNVDLSFCDCDVLSAHQIDGLSNRVRHAFINTNFLGMKLRECTNLHEHQFLSLKNIGRQALNEFQIFLENHARHYCPTRNQK